MKHIIKNICSQSGLYILLIIVEIGGIIPFFMALSNQSHILWAIAYGSGYLTFIYLMNRDENPENKILWICVVLIIPPFGALIYGLFNSRRIGRKSKRHLQRLNIVLQKNRIKDTEQLVKGDKDAFGKVKALLHDDTNAEVYQNTSSRYYPWGELMYKDMMADIKMAQHYIFLEYFVVEEGKMWTPMRELLKEKVVEGVEVRMLYDDIGSLGLVPDHYADELRKAGIACYPFSKLTPIGSVLYYNNRDHRKILIVDGTIGYTGGINLADEYINERNKHGKWKDGGIRLYGDAVRGLTKLFLSNWDLNQKTISDYETYLAFNRPSDKPICSDQPGFYIPFGSGPAPQYERPVGKNVFLNLINQAKEFVYITTPYLIIDYELTDALRNAAIRGVQIIIVTPHIPDKKLIYLITRSNYKPLMESGVKIIEYTEGFIHAKTVLVDNVYAFVGTINFDYRSLVHHYEDGVWMYQAEIIPDIEEDFNEIFKTGTKIKLEDTKLTVTQSILKNLIRIFSPLL